MNREPHYLYALSAHSRRWALHHHPELAASEHDYLRLEQPDDCNLFYPMYKGRRVPGYDAMRDHTGSATLFVLRGPNISHRPQSAQACLRHMLAVIAKSHINPTKSENAESPVFKQFQ